MDETATHTETMNCSIPSLTNGSILPQRYTRDGKNVNPPILIEHLPEHTKALVVIAENPDNKKIHWVVYNIPPVGMIEENTMLGSSAVNDFFRHGYWGPGPRGETMPFHLTVFALKTELHVGSGKGGRDIRRAMEGLVLDQSSMTFLYQSPGKRG